MTILGIETSCDETSIGIVEKTDKHLELKANVTATSLALHSQTGGIIPEIAAREQLKFMLPVLDQTLREGLDTTLQKLMADDRRLKTIDAIAVTYGPGLIGSLLVGVETAKTLSVLWNIPLIPVNHMWGHIYANWLGGKRLEAKNKFPLLLGEGQGEVSQTSNLLPQFPAIVLVVSGGHTDLLLMKGHGDIQVIGGTRDDAAGECFDKCARLLGFSYPGGPKISQLAQKGNPNAYRFPRPMIGSKDYDFSFSGLKTAFLYQTKDLFPILRIGEPNSKIGWQQVTVEDRLSADDQQKLYDLCASLEAAIVDVLVKKPIAAAKIHHAKSILLSGGVAANDLLRQQMLQATKDQRLKTTIYAPQKSLCTDNGAMIAAAAAYNFHPVPWSDITVDPELYY